MLLSDTSKSKQISRKSTKWPIVIDGLNYSFTVVPIGPPSFRTVNKSFKLGQPVEKVSKVK